MAVELRPARPTIDDGLAFARYLDVAADGFFRLLMGSASERIVAEAFTQPGHDLSAEHVTFAERDGELVGMVSSYSADDHASSSVGPFRRAAGWRIVRVAVVTLLLYPTIRFLGRLPAGDHYLQAVAVDPAVRGHGVGGRLIDHVERRAQQRGERRLALDVALDNDRARQLYERIGMTIESTSPRWLLPGTRVHRMVKDL